MDRPGPVAVTPVAAEPSRPNPFRSSATVSFGTMPATSSVKTEPLTSWQDRETPRSLSESPTADQGRVPAGSTDSAPPAPANPAAADAVGPQPQDDRAADKPAVANLPERPEGPPAPMRAPEVAASAKRVVVDEVEGRHERAVPTDQSPAALASPQLPSATTVEPAPSPGDVDRPAGEPTASASENDAPKHDTGNDDAGEPDMPVTEAATAPVDEDEHATVEGGLTKAAADAVDNVEFDFGFGSEPPEPATLKPIAPATPARKMPTDPIAALIAAELDGNGVETSSDESKGGAKPASRAFGSPDRGATLTPIRGGAAGPRPMPASPRGPRPVTDSDRFAVAPVFGADRKAFEDDSAPATVPAAGPPAAAKATAAEPQVDPIDEIESLIGEAVRVGLATPAKSQPVAVAPVKAEPPAARPEARTAPVVPPLTTGFAPRRAAIKENEPEAEAAEAAILAAAAANGAEIGRINGAAATDATPYRRRTSGRSQRRRGRVGQYVGIAVAAVLLLAVGFGIYWVLGMGHSDTEAPVVTADATPDKGPPPPTSSAANTTAADGSVVYDKMDGVANTTDEALVSRDDSANTSVADVAETVGNGDDATLNDSTLANRKVRTVTVRPDGTIVSGDDAVAGSEALPVDRPNVPDLPGADVQRSDLLAAIPDQTATDPVAAAIKESGTPTASATTGSTETAPTVSALVSPDPAATIDSSIVAPVPMPRPGDRASMAGAGQTVADVATSETPVNLLPSAQPAANVTSTSSAAAYVQLSSQKSEADAESSLNRINAKWGALFNGAKLEIQRADLGSKGVWYRVRLPASSFQDATEICASVKANGGDCIASNG